MNPRKSQQIATFFHISGQMQYNPTARDESESLLKKGILPHYAKRSYTQENGFFVWTHGGRAIRHARLYAIGGRSLVTIKVPCQSVRYPHWKFDIERMATHPFLLDGLCAKHKQIARKIFMSNDFKQEMTSVIGEGEICLAQEVLSPQIALLNKNGNLLRYVDIDSLIGLQIIRKLKEQNSTVQNEINKIETACRQGKNLPAYSNISFQGETFYTLFKDKTFQRQFCKLFLKEMNALGTDKTFIQTLKASDSFCETYLNQFQMSVAPYQTVVRKQINGKLYPLGREDCVYEKVLNALLQRSPVMRHSYNQLLQRKIKNHAISITVKDAFYPEPDEAKFPLKYTGNKILPVYSITKLSRYVNEKDKLYALSRPKSR